VSRSWEERIVPARYLFEANLSITFPGVILSEEKNLECTTALPPRELPSPRFDDFAQHVRLRLISHQMRVFLSVVIVNAVGLEVVGIFDQ